MAKFSKRSKDALIGVHPKLVALMEAAIVDTPVDFTVVEGVRTAQRQKQLYAQGRTAPGPKVTNVDGVTKKSNHQVKADGLGYAVDVYPFFDGKVQVSGAEVDKRLHILAAHIKATAKCQGVNITWGGDWKSPYDPPHYELKI